ncbi:hypothetical protein F1D05_31055 [Kribbella qitaiheensis]|uniref:Lipoprotein n=1 Tax=Kribbella qitaiheensis TaxID=1544730 RepID=A0A7G6X5N7_9ACTN|nr:hypothetical protein [Kribbella qitaiheensis]QNE21552.1 hypothetical protein F1D05_31055 [Kribbella qitaiheensis]
MKQNAVWVALVLLTVAAGAGCDNEHPISDPPRTISSRSAPEGSASSTPLPAPTSTTARPASTEPTEPSEPAAGHATVLVYLGLKYSGDPNAYLPGTSNSYVTLYADGTVLRGLPAEGPSGYEVSSRSVPDTGTFTSDGTTLEITWSAGERVEVRPGQDGHFVMYGTDYGLLDDLGGVTLSGTYRRASGGSGGRISFRSGKRFTDTGITADTGLLTTENPRGSGKYSVTENTLLLRYDDGGRQSFSVYALPQNLEALSSLVIAGFVFDLDQ